MAISFWQRRKQRRLIRRSYELIVIEAVRGKERLGAVKKPKNIFCSEANSSHCNPCSVHGKFEEQDWWLTLAVLYIVKNGAQVCYNGWVMGPGVSEPELGVFSTLQILD